MPTDSESGWVEPDIVINGRALTFAECMAVRVAIANSRLAMNAPTFKQAIGVALAEGYDRHLAAVEQTMLNGLKRAGR